MSPRLPVALTVSLYCWFALEVVLVFRDVARRKGRLRRDRGTKLIVSISLAVSIGLSILLPSLVPALGTPRAFFVAVGVVVFWAGLALRSWAVITLGGSFRTSVEVDADQAVVTAGPYRWVRHPAYTGLLLIVVGFGIGTGNLLSVIICAVVPLLGLLPRIRVEEAEMTLVLGEPYRSYQARTRRLVPGLW